MQITFFFYGCIVESTYMTSVRLLSVSRCINQIKDCKLNSEKEKGRDDDINGDMNYSASLLDLFRRHRLTLLLSTLFLLLLFFLLG